MEDSKFSMPIINTPEKYNRINEIEKQFQDIKEAFPTMNKK